MTTAHHGNAFWIWGRWKGDLKFRLAIGLSVSILVIMGIGSAMIIYDKGVTLRQAALDRSLAVSQTFALMGWATIHDNLYRIQEVMDRHLRDPNILHVDVIDHDGMITAAKQSDRIGIVLSDPTWHTFKNQPTETILYTETDGGEPLLTIIQPISDDEGTIHAWVRIISSLSHVQHEQTDFIWRLTAVTLALVTAGILAVHLTFRQVSDVFQCIIDQLQGTLRTPTGTSPEREDIRGPSQGGELIGEIEHLTSVVTQTTSLVTQQSEQRTRAEEQLQRAHSALQTHDRTRTQFFADISHELRTPLTVIRGEAEVTLRMHSAPEQSYRTALERIVRLAGEVNTLVTDLLLLARSESGAIQIELVETALHEVIDDAYLEALTLAQDTPLTMTLSPSLPPTWVRGDRQRLKQLLMILLHNAIQYTPSTGTITLTLSASNTHGTVTVQDNGIGISDDDLPRIFDRFYRGKQQSTPKQQGTGLGLAIAKWIAEAHAGTLTFTSNGEGTTAILKVPLSTITVA